MVRNGAFTSSTRVALVLLGCVALGLRLWGLTRQSIWTDELFTLKYAGLYGPLTWDGLLENLQGPLHAALLYLWCGLFGWGELSVRLPQALLSAASVPLLFLVARPVFGHGRAFAGALLLAVNPFHVWYGQEVRNYTLVVLLAILSLGAVQGLPSVRRVMVRGLATTGIWTAGLLCNLSFVFHIVAAGLWGIVGLRSRRIALGALLAAGVLTLAAVSPWIVEFYGRWATRSHLLTLVPVAPEERLRGDATAPLLGLPYAVYAFSVGFSLGPSLRELREAPSMATVGSHLAVVAATGICFGVLALAGIARWIRGDAARKLWLLALILPPLLAWGAATRNVKVFNPRYAATALPAYMLLLVEGASAVRPRWMRGILVSGVVLLSGASLVQLQTAPRYWKEDGRSAAALLKEEVRGGDLLFLIGAWEPIPRYYAPSLLDPEIGRFSVPYRVPPAPGAPETEDALARIRAARRTFVVLYRDDFMDPDGCWEAFLRSRFFIERSWEFPGVRVLALARERAS